MRALVLFIRKRGDYKGVNIICGEKEKNMNALTLCIKKSGKYEDINIIYGQERRI